MWCKMYKNVFTVHVDTDYGGTIILTENRNGIVLKWDIPVSNDTGRDARLLSRYNVFCLAPLLIIFPRFHSKVNRLFYFLASLIKKSPILVLVFFHHVLKLQNMWVQSIICIIYMNRRDSIDRWKTQLGNITNTYTGISLPTRFCQPSPLLMWASPFGRIWSQKSARRAYFWFEYFKHMNWLPKNAV